MVIGNEAYALAWRIVLLKIILFFLETAVVEKIEVFEIVVETEVVFVVTFGFFGSIAAGALFRFGFGNVELIEVRIPLLFFLYLLPFVYFVFAHIVVVVIIVTIVFLRLRCRLGRVFRRGCRRRFL